MSNTIDRDEIRIVDNAHHVAVSLGSKSIAEASNVSVWDDSKGEWYLNRVKVEPMGEGIGSRLLQKLQERLLNHAPGNASGGFDILIVEPGGYGSDPERLNKFYKRNGFVEYAAYSNALAWRRP
jgi:ribosomal protein S18 acetylase RimI-like enzyme